MWCRSKNFFLFWTVLLLYIQGIYSSLEGLIAEHPDYPGQCFYKGVALPPGTTRYNPFRNQCCKLTCKLSSERLWAEYECCQLSVIWQGCKEVSTLALAFPDCCGKPLCDDELDSK